MNLADIEAGFSFLDFEFELKGGLATFVGEAARKAGVKPVDIVRQALEASFGDIADGDLVARTTVNDGNGGFHIVTVVTDGYGNLVSEDQKGKELARVKTVDPDRIAEAAKKLIDVTWAVFDS